MALSAVATPYALALLELSIEQGTLTAVRGQLERLADVVGKSRDLQIAFANPTITTEERRNVVTKLADALILSRTTKNFLLVLAEKGRLSNFRDIVTAFGRLADERTGAARAEVVSSAALDAGQLTRLRAALAAKTGKTITLTNRVDPALIGGIRVSVDGTVYDASVATQLRKLREAILSDL